MSVRRILQLGDPTLRQSSCPVHSVSDAAPILADLRDTLHEFRRTHGFGRGIAAIQIGQPWRIVYIEFEGAAYPLINPAFEKLSDEKQRVWDNCFSFPDLMVLVERSASVVVRYMDERGRARTLKATGALAELLQHELDHLDGILAIDRAIDRNSFSTKEEYERRQKTRVAEPARSTNLAGVTE